jgi:hypothetical protein
LAQIPSGYPRPSKAATAAPQPGSDSATEAISLEGFHSYWGYPNSWMVVFVFEHLKIKNSWELGVARPTFGNLHVFIAQTFTSVWKTHGFRFENDQTKWFTTAGFSTSMLV